MPAIGQFIPNAFALRIPAKQNPIPIQARFPRLNAREVVREVKAQFPKLLDNDFPFQRSAVASVRADGRRHSIHGESKLPAGFGREFEGPLRRPFTCEGSIDVTVSIVAGYQRRLLQRIWNRNGKRNHHGL